VVYPDQLPCLSSIAFVVKYQEVIRLGKRDPLEILDYIGGAYFADYGLSEEGQCVSHLRRMFASDPELLSEVRAAFEHVLGGGVEGDGLVKLVRESFNKAICDPGAATTYLQRIYDRLVFLPMSDSHSAQT
jgi:hypothetical protein